MILPLYQFNSWYSKVVAEAEEQKRNRIVHQQRVRVLSTALSTCSLSVFNYLQFDFTIMTESSLSAFDYLDYHVILPSYSNIYLTPIHSSLHHTTLYHITLH